MRVVSLTASRFPLMEATLEELCDVTGIPAAKLNAILESMANKGLIMDLVYAGKSYFLLIPGLIGFMEFTGHFSRLSGQARDHQKNARAGFFLGRSLASGVAQTKHSSSRPVSSAVGPGHAKTSRPSSVQVRLARATGLRAAHRDRHVYLFVPYDAPGSRAETL